MEIKDGQLQVWWIPQVPMKMFTVNVYNLQEAKLLVNVLANYDLFQFENNIKPDYCNVGGLRVWDTSLDPDDKGEYWSDWYDDFNGMGFDEWCEEN
jgi:hypothetical protein